MRELNAAMAGAVAADDFDRYYDAEPGLPRGLPGAERQQGAAGPGPLPEAAALRLAAPVAASSGTWEEHSIAAEHAPFLELLARGAIREAADYLQDVHWSFKVQEHFIQAYYFAAAGTS